MGFHYILNPPRIANSADPDEISHCAAAFYQVLHCLLKTIFRGENTLLFGNYSL